MLRHSAVFAKYLVFWNIVHVNAKFPTCNHFIYFFKSGLKLTFGPKVKVLGKKNVYELPNPKSLLNSHDREPLCKLNIVLTMKKGNIFENFFSFKFKLITVVMKYSTDEDGKHLLPSSFDLGVVGKIKGLNLSKEDSSSVDIYRYTHSIYKPEIYETIVDKTRTVSTISTAQKTLGCIYMDTDQFKLLKWLEDY